MPRRYTPVEEAEKRSECSNALDYCIVGGKSVRKVYANAIETRLKISVIHVTSCTQRKSRFLLWHTTIPNPVLAFFLLKYLMYNQIPFTTYNLLLVSQLDVARPRRGLHIKNQSQRTAAQKRNQ